MLDKLRFYRDDGELHSFYTSECVSRCWGVLLHTAIFCGFRGSGVKSDKLPPVMSLEPLSVGAEDYKFENE